MMGHRVDIRPVRRWYVVVEGVNVVHLHDVGYGGALCGAPGRRDIAAAGRPICKRCTRIANDAGAAGWLFAPGGAM